MSTDGPFTRRRLSRKIDTLEANLLQIAPYVGGLVLFVSSVFGNDTSGDGSKGTPYATISKAQTVIAAQVLQLGVPQSDYLIACMAGHAETVHTAAWLTLSTGGIRIIGLGTGTYRPTLTWDATASQIIISGANTSFENFIIDFTGIDAVVAGISITAAHCRFEKCLIKTNSATAGCVLGILTAATASDLRFISCRFIGAQTNSGTTTTAQVKHEVGADALFQNCFFTGKMTQAILNATTILRCNIENCKFHVYTGTVGFTMETSSTGFVTDNRFCVASGTTPVVGAAMSFSGNRYTTEGNGPTAGTADAI